MRNLKFLSILVIFLSSCATSGTGGGWLSQVKDSQKEVRPTNDVFTPVKIERNVSASTNLMPNIGEKNNTLTASGSRVKVNNDVVVARKEKIKRPKFVPLKDKKVNTRELVREMSRKATVEPEEDNFYYADMRYDYVEGKRYKIYVAPGRVTVITLGPGEYLTTEKHSSKLSNPPGFDLDSSFSGENGETLRHIMVTTDKPGREGTLTLFTNKRLYHILLQSYENDYMTEVSWKYSNANLYYATDKTRIAPKKSDENQFDASKVGASYRLEAEGDLKPGWYPVSVYDYQNKAYIRFPDDIGRYKLPTLYVLNKNRNAQEVNAHMIDCCTMEIDRLFDLAELRIISGSQRQVVRIYYTPHERNYNLYW